MSFNRTLFAEKLSTLKQTADSVCAVAQYAIYHRGKAETVKAVIELWLSGLRTADRKRHVIYIFMNSKRPLHTPRECRPVCNIFILQT